MKVDALRHAMYFGLIYGVLFFLNFLIGSYPAISFLQFAMYVIIPYVGYRFMVDCRQKIYDGVMSYSAAWFYSFQLFFYGSFISAALKVIYLKFINTNFLQKMIDMEYELIETLPDPSLGDSIIATLESVFQPVSFSLIVFIMNIFFGALFSLVMAAFVYKRPNPFDTPSTPKTND